MHKFDINCSNEVYRLDKIPNMGDIFNIFCIFVLKIGLFTILNIKEYERRISNKMIEEFMLVSNETIAEHFYWLGLLFLVVFICL